MTRLDYTDKYFSDYCRENNTDVYYDAALFSLLNCMHYKQVLALKWGDVLNDNSLIDKDIYSLFITAKQLNKEDRYFSLLKMTDHKQSKATYSGIWTELMKLHHKAKGFQTKTLVIYSGGWEQMCKIQHTGLNVSLAEKDEALKLLEMQDSIVAEVNSIFKQLVTHYVRRLPTTQRGENIFKIQEGLKNAGNGINDKGLNKQQGRSEKMKVMFYELQSKFLALKNAEHLSNDLLDVFLKHKCTIDI